MADLFIAGQMTTDAFLKSAWGVMEAADLRLTPTWDQFYLRWASMDGANELLVEPWAPPGAGSPEKVMSAARELRRWAVAESGLRSAEEESIG
jgi:hypothetical protein